MTTKISLIIPCYNEAESLSVLFQRCEELVSRAADSLEIILVNNGSTDKSEHLFTELKKGPTNLKLISIKENKGYGGGILSGLQMASGTHIGWTHADLQTDVEDVLKVIPILRAAKDEVLIKGSRKERPIGDRIFTAGMSAFESLLFFRLMNDINAQPTIFSRELFDSCIDPPQDFSLDLYFYYLATLKKYKIERVPVVFKPRLFGHSKWNFDFKSKLNFILRTVSFSLALRFRRKRP